MGIFQFVVFLLRGGSYVRLVPHTVMLGFVNGLGIVIAYAFVAWSFLVLRRNEPGMPRPYRVRHGIVVGRAALVLSIGIGILYLPGSPAALVWPFEWAIFIGWAVFGVMLYALGRLKDRST